MSQTTDEELFKLAAKYGILLNAIIFKDQLNGMNLMRGGYIINLANSDSHGTHWVCFWIDDPKKNDAVIYFDSFGIAPPIEVRKALKKIALKILVNDKQIQNVYSGWCGIYCLFFMWFMQKHSKINLINRLNLFLNLFDDVEKNLTILKKVFI